jgi:hypothetical protein
MAVVIGPHFPDELRAAGLLNLPFTWGPDGAIQYDARLTANQRTAIQAVLAAHNPATPADPTAQQVAAGVVVANRFPSDAQIDAAFDAVTTLPQLVTLTRRLAHVLRNLAIAAGVDS